MFRPEFLSFFKHTRKKNYFTVKLNDKLVLSGKLDENNICVSSDREICYQNVCLKHIEICVNWNDKELNVKGQICRTVYLDFNVTLFKW